jgi:hypothetical protein
MLAVCLHGCFSLTHVKTVYGCMVNEFAGHAPTSLRMVCDRLRLASIDPRSLWPQQVLV